MVGFEIEFSMMRINYEVESAQQLRSDSSITVGISNNTRYSLRLWKNNYRIAYTVVCDTDLRYAGKNTGHFTTEAFAYSALN